MKLSIELTLYPLQDDYLNIIKAVIDKLNSYESLAVTTFPTATIIIGDYDTTMAALQDIVKWSYEQYGKCVFVAKFLPGYEAQ